MFKLLLIGLILDNHTNQAGQEKWMRVDFGYLTTHKYISRPGQIIDRVVFQYYTTEAGQGKLMRVDFGYPKCKIEGKTKEFSEI